MNIVQEYLEIVDIRFENRFIWDMDIQEELLDARMPKMILQPLVENAIYHGLEKKAGELCKSLRRRRGRTVDPYLG